MSTFKIIDTAGTGQERSLPLFPGLSLAQHLFLAGAFPGRALCSGAGRCGLCQVRFAQGAPDPLPSEASRISPGRLAKGWRLACRHRPEPGAVVEAGLEREQAAPPVLPVACGDGWLGLDLGTTSIQWRFEGLGRTLAGGGLNPQAGAGAEVMSRLALAATPQGGAALRRAVVRFVRHVLAGLPCLPEHICLAGNTCMTYLALGRDVSGLSAAPYRVDWPGGGEAVLDDGLPRVYIPPLPGPFVGGDVSAGLAAVSFSGKALKPPWLLADLGTNGEFALVLPGGSVLLASVPMGPALEGVGMAKGMLAGPGAAVAFEAAPTGLRALRFGGGSGPVVGISGTGYISLLALLKRLGALDEAGRFLPGAASPLTARALATLAARQGEPSLDADGVLVFASDVEALLKVKAAFVSAVRLLLDEAGLSFKDLSAVLLAGALGEHARPADLETLGFFPPGGVSRVLAVGNASLEGACLAAARQDVRAWLDGLAGRTRVVEVVSAAGFQRMFIDAMRFAHA